MATTASIVKRLSGPEPIAGAYQGVFELSLDTTDATGIVTLDLREYFSEVHGALPAGNDALADNGYKLDFIVPAAGVAIDATNVQISVHEAAADGGPFDPVVSTDMSAIGSFRAVIFGKGPI